jgi:hypothetical protein
MTTSLEVRAYEKFVVPCILYTGDLGKEDQLIETMKLVKASGFDWKNQWFTEAAFPKQAVTEFIDST